MEIVNKVLENEKEFSYVIGFFNNEKIKSEKYQAKLNELLLHPSLKKDLAQVNVFNLVDEGLPKTIYLVSLGDDTKYDYKELNLVLRNIATKTEGNLIVNIDSFVGGLSKDEVLKKAILNLDYYAYKYEECKSKKEEKTKTVYFEQKQENKELVAEYFNLAKAIRNARDLVNKPYNYLSAPALANYAEELAESIPEIECQILGVKEIEELKMGAFLGVNKGSFDEAKLIYLTYTTDKKKPYLGLVGKGVMYDTGGYSIKTSMNNMKSDMSGAAIVLALIEVIAKNKLPINIKVVICATDNRIDGKAILPDDVLTSMNGKTIEIVSTDAEGRLTLADGLTFIQKEGCKTVIDLATLTGAVVVALGDYTTGLFGNDEKLIQTVLEYGKQEDEHIWELPITDHVRGRVRSSKVADLTNSTGRAMGASGAAAFLEEFVEEGTKWLHFDIAGTAFHTSPAYSEHYGASGVMIKTLYQVLKNNFSM